MNHHRFKTLYRGSTSIPGHVLFPKPKQPTDAAADRHRGREARLRQETGGTERA